MNRTVDFHQLSEASLMISAGLPVAYSEDMPEDVAETLALAKEQMTAVPAAAADLEAARWEFGRLCQALERMTAIAAESSKMADNETRTDLEAEFIELSKIVADVAGRAGYQGPEISVANRPQAKAAIQILRMLDPVKNVLAEGFQEQETLILEAVEETITFLKVVDSSFPNVSIASELPNLLKRVECTLQRMKSDGPIPGATAILH